MRGRVLRRSALALASVLAALAGLVAVAAGVPGERRVLVLVSSGQSLDPLAQVVDRATGFAPVAGLTALVVLLLLARGRTAHAVLIALSVGGAIAGTALLKRLVRRPRPELVLLEDVSAFSFPSGHAAATAALAIAVTLTAAGTRWLRPAVTAMALLVVTASAAQLVLARHHPSDVVAGVLWAAAWTSAVWGCWPDRAATDATDDVARYS